MSRVPKSGHIYVDLESGDEPSGDLQPPPRKQWRTTASKASSSRRRPPMSEASGQPGKKQTKKQNLKKKKKLHPAAQGKSAERLPDYLSLEPAESPRLEAAVADPPRAKVSESDISQSHVLHAAALDWPRQPEGGRDPTSMHPSHHPPSLDPGRPQTQRPPLLVAPVGHTDVIRGARMHSPRQSPPVVDLRGSGNILQSPQLSPIVHVLPGGAGRGPHFHSPTTPFPQQPQFHFPPRPQPLFRDNFSMHGQGVPPRHPQYRASPDPQHTPERDDMSWHNRLQFPPPLPHIIRTSPCPQAPVCEKPSAVGPSPTAAPVQNQPPQVFPNPDTPNEIVPPAHPSFHPQMDPASSSLSTRLTFRDVRGRPDSLQVVVKKINDRLDAIIDDLASTGKFIPEYVVKKFKDKLMGESRGAGYHISERDIMVMEKYFKTHGRIAQLIQMFCWMSPITSLYELERALVSVEKVETFQELRIGPLIKHPAVAKFFQPPSDLRETPEITAHQIQKTLMKFLDKKRGAVRGEKHSIQDFLEFFAKSLSQPSPHHLCVRITSFPLAIQTNFAFRRMQRQSRERVQGKVDEEIRTIVTHEVDQVRWRLSSFSDPRSNSVAAKEPTTLIADVFSLLSHYLPGYQSAKVNAFLQLICNQEHLKRMFLLAVYVGAYGIDGLAKEAAEESREVQHVPQFVPQPNFFHRTHGEILDALLPLLKRQPFPISLSSLAEIERAVVARFDAQSFHPLSRISFLDFLTSDDQCRAALGGSLTIGAPATDDSRRRRVVEIVTQLRQMERNDKEVVLETLKLQCRVTTVDGIGCGSTEKIISDVNARTEANQAAGSCVTYLAPLLMNGTSSNSHKQWSSQTLGALGNKSKEDALSCLCQAALLEDLSSWSHWDLIFKPQHGDLAQFIEREGPHAELHVLEVSPGVLLRVDHLASHQKFLEAVEARDPASTSGQLVSIAVQQGSVHEVSMQLLGSHVQTVLDRMVTESAQSNEAGCEQTLSATEFVYHCLVRIPLKICQFLAKEVFLEPLRRACSSAAVESLLGHCGGGRKDREGRRHLQALGMCLGVKAWTDDFSTMLGETQCSQAQDFLKQKPPTSTHLVKPSDGDEQTSIPGPAIHSEITMEEPATQEDDQVSSDPMATAADPEREAKCRRVIESIRSEDFGIGLELEGPQKEVAQKQRQREGRGLQRLSKELYSKDTHFVLELIQNADDNSYDKSLLSASPVGVPALKFIVGLTSVTVLNNEVGFNERNIHAICDVGRSTKEAHRSGYIGQKGIGFKSVFRITDTPEIHSGGYHIRFDAKCDAIGYILPHWIEEEGRENATVGNGWSTTIVLPLKEDQIAMNLVRKFQDVRPSLLLFLHRLRSITVEHQDSGETRYMTRSDGSEGIVQIEHNTDEGRVELDTWLVVRKHLTNASQFKAEVEVTEVALAFPLGADRKTVILAKDLQQQQVFAFLPLRSYGFRFIVQGDFDLPSSREDVNSDSVWNQFIRDEIPLLFLHALDRIKSLAGISVTEAVALFLQFIPLDGDLHDFFKPVAIRIRNLLRGAACLPTETGSEHISEPFSIIRSLSREDTVETRSLWKQPSELVVATDGFIRRVIPQSLLNSALHYFYLSPELAPFVSPALQDHLGLHSLSVDHLTAVAEAVVRSYSGAFNSVIMLSDDSDEDAPTLRSYDEEDDGSPCNKRGRLSGKVAPLTPHSVFVQWVAQWLACVHIVLEDEGDRSPVTIGKLKKTKILPLTNGARVAAQDGSIFFPSDGGSVSSAVFKRLFDEIMVVDPQLFEVQAEQEATGMVKTSHRVHSVLELLGVREMYPAEVIRHHILPCFQSEQWKTKPAALLTSYLVYIKDSLGVQGSGVTETEIVSLLRDCVAVVTRKHGALQPAREVLHFSSQFQPSYDLEKLFPDVQWKLVSPDYLKNFTAQNAMSSWRSFLIKLGVRDKIAVEGFTEKVPQENDQWQQLREFVGRSPDGVYTLRDHRCSEFEDIVRSVRASRRQSGHRQMLELLRLLDGLWDQEYRQFSFAKCYDGSNENYIGGDKSMPSALHRALKDLAWLPAVSLPSQKPYGEPDQLYRGRELFDRSKANQRLLDCHVPYVASEIKNSHLLELLQVRCQVSAEEMVGFLQEWSAAASAPGAGFRASIAHMTEVYLFLYQQSQQMYSKGQGGESIIDRLLSADQAPIFVPDVYDSNTSPDEQVKGRFHSVHSVCWVDPSGVLYIQQQHNRRLPSDLPRVLQLYYGSGEGTPQKYQELKMAFEFFGVRGTPTAAAYIATLQFVSSLEAIPEKHHINDFTSIALHLSRVCMKGDITPQFLQQQLRGIKVFPSHRDLWVSMDSCLLESDDPQLEKVFSECKDVHFLKWPAAAMAPRKRAPRHRQYEEQQKEDERKHFVDVCGIAKLSGVVESRVVPEGEVRPLEDLRRRLHTMVPLLQKYLVANEEELYQSLLKDNIKGKLEKMFIASVLSLKCLYSIQYRGFAYASPSQSSPGSDFVDSSNVDTAVLYVVASKVDSPKVLVPTLVKIFTGKRSAAKFSDPKDFENLVKDMLLLPIGEVEGVLSDPEYSFGEVDADSVWVIPFEEEPEPSESESEDEWQVSGASPDSERMDTRERQTESDGLKSWPPKAPVSAGGSSQYPPKPPPPGSAVADVVGEDDIRKISDKYAMGNRPPSRRQDQRPVERGSERPQKLGRGDDGNAPVVASPNERHGLAPNLDDKRGPGDGAPRLDRPRPAEVGRTERHSPADDNSPQPQQVRDEQPNVAQDVGGKSSTTGRNTESSHERRGDKSSGGAKRKRGWQETLGPDAALFAQGIFSIASALQPVSQESAEDLLNRSFLESCDQERVGRWGEEYVYKYLTAASHLPSGQLIKSVTWINEAKETGKPYDLEVEIEPQVVLYIEVKSTKSSEKEFMEFSWNELQFADQEKQSYHLYRVYSAGSELVILKWMENLANILTTHPVRLFLEL